MRKTLITLLMVLSCQSYGQVQEYTLNNGLKVLVKEDHRAPIAVSMIWYKVGSADEPGHLTGVSHAIEHMMFKGTPKFPVGFYSKAIAEQGGQDNAFTNNDYTAYFTKMDASRIATSFEMEADRMNHLLLDDKEFSKEIKVIQEERRLRTDNNPQALTFERFLATAHLSAPYHHPVIGWMSVLKQMKIEDLRAWYQQYYAPNNATLVVVGDVNPQEIHALAQKYFGAIPQKTIMPKRSQQEPPALGKKSILVKAPAKMPLFLMGYTVPSVKTAKNPWEPYALELIAGILDAGESSRFARNLVRGKQVAANAEVHYNLYTQYQSQFTLYGTPSQMHSVEELQHDLSAELDALKNTTISEKELQRVKNQIIAQKTYEEDSVFGQAMQLGLLETIGLGWKSADSYTQAINSITPEQIQQTAQRYFQSNELTEATLVPTESSEASS